MFIRDEVTGQQRIVDDARIMPAGFWMRTTALVVDLLVAYMIYYSLGIFCILIADIVFQTFISDVTLYGIIFTTLFLVFSLMEGRGGTPGKIVIGARVVDEDGYIIGFPGGVMRIVLKFFSLGVLGFGLWRIAWDPYKQGLHDAILKTYVIEANHGTAMFQKKN
jgi:uncharacterized RDD family membrane protein YckC